MRPLVLAVALVLSACAPAAPTGPTFHKDVEPIVQRSCSGCHATGGIAPFALETFAQAKEHAVSIAAQVQARRMPPWQPAEGCGQPFVDDAHLEQAEIDTIVAWAENPNEGNPADAPTEKAQMPVLARVDAALKMPAPYTPDPILTDDYRCFLIDPNQTETKFVTGYDIKPGQPSEVHHVILYTVDKKDAVAADAKDPGPGWSCFGGAGVDLIGALGAWAPGTGAVRFPGGTGVALDPGNAIAMQIHYNTRSGVRVADETQANLMFADRLVTSAILIPLPADRFAIPPKAMGYTYTERFKNVFGVEVDIWGLLPHMHTRGVSITMKTDSQCLVSIPKWDFQWQRVYFRTKAVTIGVNDGVSLECKWDNPDDVTVRWGERTSDEMCFAFVYGTLH